MSYLIGLDAWVAGDGFVPFETRGEDNEV